MRLAQNIAMGLGALRANFLSARVPLSVMLSVTNRCNSKCWYCDIPLRRQKEMSTQEILTLIDEMAEAGVRKLSLWGGEPLLRNDIGRLIDRAKEKGMYVNIDTNGYLIPERFESIRNLDFIISSFDGDKDVHDKNREPGAYDKFIRALAFINRRIPVWTLTVLTRHNIESVDFIIEKANEFGFFTLFQVPYHPSQIGSAEDLFASSEEYRRVFNYLIKLKKEGAPIISSTQYLNAVAKWGFYPEMTSETGISGFPQCWAGRLFCNIDTNGDLYPCSPMIGKMKDPPNALREGFARSFNRLQSPQCRACLSACCLEANYVFSFDWRSIAEWMRVTS